MWWKRNKNDRNVGCAKPSNHQWPPVQLGHPCTSGPLTVFPIVDSHSHAHDYVLLADAVDAGIASVKEKNTRGDIPVIEIHNRGEQPLLGIQGEEYVGAKQNRTLNISVLAGPGKTRVPVTCVEMGRWDSGPVDFSKGSYEPLGLRAMKTAGLHASSKEIGHALQKFFADQGRVWDSVRCSSALHGVSSPTAAMFDIYKSKVACDKMDDIVEELDLPADTSGVVIGMGGRVVACDLFENNAVFTRMSPRLMRSYALSTIGTEGVPPSLEAAESFLNQPLRATPYATPSVGLGEDVRWDTGKSLATALVWQDRFVHATIFSHEVV